MEFVKGGLRDISVTRLRLPWGVPCPIDEKHTIYVWIDALINYISVLGYPSGERFSTYWPVNVHLVGKDILKFHAVIWPCILMALGIPLPEGVFAHGWWKNREEKMSKSRGNVVDPYPFIDRYGTDALRYFLLREVPFGEDGNFSVPLFVKRVNSDLANDLGNLLSRTVPLIERYCAGRVPAPSGNGHGRFPDLVSRTAGAVDECMTRFAFPEALDAIWQIVREANLYADQSAPWRLAKDPLKASELHTVLYHLSEALRVLGLLLFPFIPSSAERIWQELGIEETPAPGSLAVGNLWGELTPGLKVHKGPPLFPRIMDEEG